MSVERIRHDHLEHLIDRSRLGDEEKKDLKAKLQSGSAADKEAVLVRLEQLVSGTREHLSRIWTAYGRQALFLWGTPALATCRTPAQARKWVADAVARTEPSFREAQVNDQWHKIKYREERRAEAGGGGRLRPRNASAVPSEDPGTPGEEQIEKVKARVLRVRLVDTQLGVTVRMSKRHSYVLEDEDKVFLFTYDIRLVIDLKSEGKLAKVFGAQQDGRTAMRTFLEWLLGEQLPGRRPDLDEYMLPIKFSERHIKRLATQLGMPCVGMEGPDSQGVVGKVGYEGRAQGAFHFVPLDMADARVKSQDRVPQDARTYNFTFEHTRDTFKEASRVVFNLKSQQPHVSFPVRTSQSAMEYMVGELYAEVRRAP